SSVEAASAAWMPEGMERTIVLAPGIYSTAMNLTSDVNLSGPYFGKNPNNNPNLPDYDPSEADWALMNGRSIDPTKEAVFTADILIGTGCNNVTIDGIAFTGKGRIKDTSRAAERIVVNYNFKNLFFLNSDCDSYFLMNSNVVNRFITIDSVRIEKNDAVSRLHNTKAESVILKNSYVKGLKEGADKSTNSLIEYLGGIDPSDSLAADKHLSRHYLYNHIEDVGGINSINFAARDSGVAGIGQRSRVTIELIGNEFVDVATAVGNRVIQDQISYHNQEFICKDNLFALSSGDGSPAFGTYYDGVGGTPSYTHVEISGNRFEGYKTPLSSSSSYPYYFDSTNEFYDGKGAAMSFSSGSAILQDSAPNLITAWNNGEVLKYNTTRRLYIYPEDVSSGSYQFDFENNATTQSGVTLKAYTDSSATDEISKIPLSKDENKTIAYIVATKGATTETYEVTIFAFPVADAGDEGVDESASGDCKLHLFSVPGAKQVVENTNSYTVIMDENVKSIKPSINVDMNASYKFYLDAECKYPAPSSTTVNLESKYNTFYIQVTAANGTKSEPISVMVQSDRASVAYSDLASVPTYARKAMNFLNNEGFGIFVGDQNKRVNPNANITRYELAKVMVTLSGLNVEMAESVKLHEIYDDFFTMQKEAPWALPYIREATAAGLIQGISDQNNLYFAGSSTTTREQFTAVFMRSVAVSANTTVDEMYNANSDAIEAAYKNKFKDAKNVSSWARKAVKLANFYQYVQGDGKNLNPKDNVIRADVAVIVYNSVKY
ncbi:MAG: S-layer homology domain-containing protein, partial [Clostridia bacterium]|nr:S-layer homology domain-containing protein [Clostridia bacterium]